MIKVDIINEVVEGRRHHEGQGRGGGRGRPRGDEGLLDEGRADRAARLRRLPGEAAQARHRPQPADRQGSEDPARTDDPLQARQGPAEPRPSSPVRPPPDRVRLPAPSRAEDPVADRADRQPPLPDPDMAPLGPGSSAVAVSVARRAACGRVVSCDGALGHLARRAAPARRGPHEHPARPRDGPLRGVPALRGRRHAALLHPVSARSAWWARWARSSASGGPSRIGERSSTSESPGRSRASWSACRCWCSACCEATVRAHRATAAGPATSGSRSSSSGRSRLAARARRRTAMTLVLGPLGPRRLVRPLRDRPEPDAGRPARRRPRDLRALAASRAPHLARRPRGLPRACSTCGPTWLALDRSCSACSAGAASAHARRRGARSGRARLVSGLLGFAIFAVCFTPDPILISWYDFLETSTRALRRATAASHHADRVDVDGDSRPARGAVALDERLPHRVAHGRARWPFSRTWKRCSLAQAGERARGPGRARGSGPPRCSRSARGQRVGLRRPLGGVLERARRGSRARPPADSPSCGGTPSRARRRPGSPARRRSSSA